MPGESKGEELMSIVRVHQSDDQKKNIHAFEPGSPETDSGHNGNQTPSGTQTLRSSFYLFTQARLARYAGEGSVSGTDTTLSGVTSSHRSAVETASFGSCPLLDGIESSWRPPYGQSRSRRRLGLGRRRNRTRRIHAINFRPRWSRVPVRPTEKVWPAVSV